MRKTYQNITYIVLLLLVAILRPLQASFLYKATRYIKGAYINKRLRTNALYGYLNNVKYYFVQGADIDAKDFDGKTALLLSAQEGHLDCVRYLYQKGADVRAEDKYTYTALLLSACNGHFDCLKFLVRRGAYINAKDNLGWTALHWGAYKRRLDYIEFLVAHGADIYAKNENGDTALYLSARYGYSDCAHYLEQQMQNCERQLNIEATRLANKVKNGPYSSHSRL